MGHNILVTGGAGYLGSILIPELLQSGNRVTVLDNFTYKQNSLAHVCNDSNFQVVKGDVRLKKPCYHCSMTWKLLSLLQHW
jgi:nucleoside-diphosphate-sugar epimerase